MVYVIRAFFGTGGGWSGHDSDKINDNINVELGNLRRSTTVPGIFRGL